MVRRIHDLDAPAPLPPDAATALAACCHTSRSLPSLSSRLPHFTTLHTRLDSTTRTDRTIAQVRPIMPAQGYERVRCLSSSGASRARGP
jgi:hypothetical protein